MDTIINLKNSKISSKFSFLKNIYFIYTITFLILSMISFLPFLLEGKSFIWNHDGINQHYPMLVYYGKVLRGLFQDGFQMVDFNLGMGYDTITTLNYYVLGDPITLLSVFITPSNSVALYGILVILRFYLSGISFIVLGKYWKKDGLLGVLLGALIYTFCGYALYAGVRHPFFLNPMIYLPLILVGLEEVLRRKKPYLLIGIVFISAISNFYFLYMLSIIAVGYVVFRYIVVYRKDYRNPLVGFILTGFRAGGYYLLGLTLASFILIPIIYAFLQNGRLNQSPLTTTGYLIYSKKYYLSLVQSIFASGKSPGYWSLLSFSSVTAVSGAIIFCRRKFSQLSVTHILVIVALSIPAFGYFMNGFSYISNRWSFSISLLVAISFTLTFDYLFELKTIEKILIR